MDNNENEKKEVKFNDIDENSKVTKENKESEISENKNEKKEDFVYDDIDENDKIRADEINNEKKAKVRKSSKTISREIIEWVSCFVIAYVLYLIINYFFGTISGVKQVSMLPTTEENDRLLISRPVIFKRDLKYGDIITFEAPFENNLENRSSDIAPYEEKTGIASFIYNFVGIGKSSYIKRVIGLPGDHVVISDDGAVYRNGEKLDEPYLNQQDTNKDIYSDIVVPAGTIFVMGDNRLSSKDSRYFGCVPIEKVNGYVIARVWPLNKLGKLK